MVTEISKFSIHKTFKKHKFQGNKIRLVQELKEDDQDRKMQFAKVMTQLLVKN